MTDPTHSINPIQPTGPAERQDPKADPAEFRRILEQLEAVSKQVAPEKKPEGPAEFVEAMKKADDEFLTVMDLRRQLEDAYRSRQS